LRFSDFIGLRPPLTIRVFLALRNLAILDRFYGLTDVELEERTGNSPEELARLRGHLHYTTILAATEEKADYLARPRTFDKWAEDVEDRVAGETLAVALTEGRPKEKLAALAEFSGRRSAKKSRDDETGPVFYFPPDALKLMGLAIKMQPLSDEGGPDGTRLNVPAREAKRIGEGGRD
jgi:hypothetical protein